MWSDTEQSGNKGGGSGKRGRKLKAHKAKGGKKENEQTNHKSCFRFPLWKELVWLPEVLRLLNNEQRNLWNYIVYIDVALDVYTISAMNAIR